MPRYIHGMSRPRHFDAIIIGAGAAGLFCAARAGQRGRRVALIDHAQTIGEKIRISGGGRCNFTNVGAGPANYLSQNPHFCRSALSRFTPQDFIALVTKHRIAFHDAVVAACSCYIHCAWSASRAAIPRPRSTLERPAGNCTRRAW